MTAIVGAQNSTTDPNSASTILPVAVETIVNVDPIADLASTAPTRVTQQRIVPAGVKQRNVRVQLLNDPSSATGDPLNTAAIFGPIGPVTSQGSRTITWLTNPNNPDQTLLAMSQMSFYFSAAPYYTYADWIANVPEWPNSTYNMTNIVCTFWQDEATSDIIGNSNGVFSKQSCYNFGVGGSVFLMATLRLRIIANTTSISTS